MATIRKLEELMDINAENFQCSACEDNFVWANDENPKFCPCCGMQFSEIVESTEPAKPVSFHAIEYHQQTQPVEWLNLKRSKQPPTS